MEVPEYTGVDAESTGHAKTNCRQHAPVAKEWGIEVAVSLAACSEGLCQHDAPSYQFLVARARRMKFNEGVVA